MKRSANSLFFLQLCLALMFIAIGILGIMEISNNANSNFFNQISNSLTKTFGTKNDVIPIMFSILEIVSGLLLLLSLFTKLDAKFLSIALLLIFIFWGINIFMVYVLNGAFKSNFVFWVSWISGITPQLVILSALWIVYKKQ